MCEQYQSRAFGTKVPGAFCFLAGWVMLLASCARQDEPIHLQGEAQGTYYSITYFDPEGRDLQPQVDSLLQAFDQTASLWVEESLLRRVNSNKTDTVSPLFADLLQKSAAIRRHTDGSFDCRVGRIVQAWGFSFKQREELSTATLDSLMLYSHAAVWLDTQDDGTILLRKELPETELDFNAIAQGYSVDLLAGMMEQYGIENYLIDVGGEVRGRGGKPDGEPWTVGIEKPAADKYGGREIETAIALKNASVVTSGNYRKYYEKEGTRYSHTIDPATGRPVTHSLLSVSVVSSEAWYADAMATAFMVMGLEKALKFIADLPEDTDIQGAAFIYDSAGTNKTYYTPGFREKIKQ